MTDAEALEVQSIENLQREDIHPLEEAQAFRALLDVPDQQYTTARIGERAGKSAAYIASRLKLTELVPDVAEAFLADRITLGHALLIAKLPAAQQQEAFKAAFKSTWMGSGQTEILVPVRELTAWIDSNLLLDLKTAPLIAPMHRWLPRPGAATNARNGRELTACCFQRRCTMRASTALAGKERSRRIFRPR